MGDGFTFKPVALGMVFAVLTMGFGELVAIGVGVAEEPLEDWIAETVAAHPQNPDLAKSSPEAVEGKAMRYVLRGHFHGTGIGAMSVGLILALAASWVSVRWKTILSLGVGIGGFLYPISWFGAGLLMPSMGKEAARGAFEWLVFPGIAVQYSCLLLILWIWLVAFFSPGGTPQGYDLLKR